MWDSGNSLLGCTFLTGEPVPRSKPHRLCPESHIFTCTRVHSLSLFCWLTGLWNIFPCLLWTFARTFVNPTALGDRWCYSYSIACCPYSVVNKLVLKRGGAFGKEQRWCFPTSQEAHSFPDQDTGIRGCHLPPGQRPSRLIEGALGGWRTKVSSSVMHSPLCALHLSACLPTSSEGLTSWQEHRAHASRKPPVCEVAAGLTC